MNTLHLGVVDVSYTKPSAAIVADIQSAAPPGKQAPKSKIQVSVTIGDVADILEAKYHVMATFWELHGQDIADAIAESVAGNLENLLLGAPLTDNVTADAEEKAETLFRQFLENREMDGIAEGVPTQAARRGVNHRLAHPYAKGNSIRPSFIDTGIYETSFKVWTD